MDLSTVATVTLQLWQQQALANVGAWMSGLKPASLSYSQGDGGRSISYQTTTLADARAWLARLTRELACRGVLVPNWRRRAIGVRF